VEKCNLAGMEIASFVSLDEAVRHLLPPTGPRFEKLVAMNAEKVLKVRQDEGLRSLLSDGTCIYPDGISVVWSLRRRNVAAVKIAGCDLWEALMQRAARLDLSILLLGGREDVSVATMAKLKADVGAKHVSRLNGYDYSDEEIFQLVERTRPNFVTVALGSPRQELLIENMRARHESALYMGVGGTYDVYTGRLKRAPEWMLRMNLEFLFRLIQEPLRLFRQLGLAKYVLLELSGRL